MAANTTIKVATLSAAAKDDAFSVLEGNGDFLLNVLANDPGSAALYSVAQVSGLSSAQFPVATSATLASGATIKIVNGQIEYTNNNVQYLAAGETKVDTFTYTVRMANGALSTATASVTIVGENDVATISGSTSGALTEDDAPVRGTLSVSDADHDQSAFGAVSSHASVGSFSFNNGAWTYATGAAAQALAAGETATETLTVSSLDGSASKTVSITVTGVNDVAVMGGDTAGALSEDDAAVHGTLTVSDADHDQSAFGAVSSSASVGSFSFDNGAWTYTTGDAAQALAAGETATETLTVASLDGSASETVSVTVTGVNDVAVMGGDTAGALSEDDDAVHGTLTVSDADHDQSAFGAVSSHTSVGAFSFDNGAWTYTAGAAAQALAAGESATETLTVASLDGSASETVSVTVTGVNDAASISGSASGNVVEDSGVLTTSGILSVSDADHGENHFASVSAAALQGTYGAFTFDADTGAWSYALDNDAAQSLNGGDIAYDELVVASADGSASETISVSIHGVNEPAAAASGSGGGSGGSGESANPSTQFIVNQGIDVTNGRIVLNGFDANDSLHYTHQFTLQSYAQTDYNNDGVLDTAVEFAYQQNRNSAPTNVEVILVGYTGLTDAQLTHAG